MNNKVSIIVPIYNVEKYLRECVDSILAQTHKDIEVILVDDGSPDNCGKICDDYSKKDSRIKVVHKPNGGLSSARNAGLDVATGDYIMFIDSDDFIDSNMVEELLSIKKESGADIVSCGIYRYNGKCDTIINKTISKNRIEILDQTTALKRLILLTLDCSSCNKLYPKDFICNIRFMEGRNNEDHPFLFNLYQKIQSIAYTNKAYYHYRITPNSITNTLNEKSFDIFKNADDIEKIIKERNLDLRKEFYLYKILISITFARTIQKQDKQQEFSARYNEFRRTIKSNYLKIIFCSFFSIRNKLHATWFLLTY